MPPLEKVAQNIGDFVKKNIVNQIKLQGHNLTGKLTKSVSYKVFYTQQGISLIFEMEEYGAILNKGVKANKIPFGGNTGAKRSKYIQGLKRFAQLRFFVDEKKALQIAFAIAHAHKRDGMPTRKSFRFSKTGKRTNFIEDALADSYPDILKLLGELELIIDVQL